MIAYLDPGTGSYMFQVVVGLLLGALLILPSWKIFSKAGYSGWLSLTMFVPLLNILMMFFLAFADWPVRRELDSLKPSGQEE